jgi:hypothetical protein
MATRPDYAPKADQPRVSTGELKRTEAARAAAADRVRAWARAFDGLRADFGALRDALREAALRKLAMLL